MVLSEKESRKAKVNRLFEQFLGELCDHIRVAGGIGDPNRIRKQSLEEIYKELEPNDIVIGFRNKRMTGQYQLSHQMRDIFD